MPGSTGLGLVARGRNRAGSRGGKRLRALEVRAEGTLAGEVKRLVRLPNLRLQYLPLPVQPPRLQNTRQSDCVFGPLWAQAQRPRMYICMCTHRQVLSLPPRLPTHWYGWAWGDAGSSTLKGQPGLGKSTQIKAAQAVWFGQEKTGVGRGETGGGPCELRRGVRLTRVRAGGVTGGE